MLDGPNWNETNWNWKTSLLNLRQHISNKTDDIFKAAIKRVIENNAVNSTIGLFEN